MSYIYYQSSTVVLGLDCSWYCRRSSLHHNLYGTMCATSACLNSLNLFLPTQAFFGSHVRSKSSKSSREVTATEELQIQPARDSTPPRSAKEKTLHFDGVCTCGRFKWARSNPFLCIPKTQQRAQAPTWFMDYIIATVHDFDSVVRHLRFKKSIALRRFQARHTERDIKRTHLSPELLKAKYVHLVGSVLVHVLISSIIYLATSKSYYYRSCLWNPLSFSVMTLTCGCINCSPATACLFST